MTPRSILSRLEHLLLSRMVDSPPEPLHILYADANRDVPEATLQAVMEALVKLTDMGLVICILLDQRGGRRPCHELTVELLEKHCSGRTDDELRHYPKYGDEYEFEPTPEGRTEEAKDVYEQYY